MYERLNFRPRVATLLLAACCYCAFLGVAACSPNSNEDEVMAVYVKMHCKSCGKTHKFCLPKKSEFSLTESYEYVCPESGNPAVVTPGQKGKAVKRRPRDSIIVKPQPLREP